MESGHYLSMTAAQVVVMGPFLMLSIVAAHAYAPQNLKIYGLSSLAFMIDCISITSCINFLLLMVSSRPRTYFRIVARAFSALPLAGPHVHT